MTVAHHETCQDMRIQILFSLHDADGPMAADGHSGHLSLLLDFFVLVDFDRASQQGGFGRAHSAPDDSEERPGEIMVAALVVETLCD